MTTNYPFEGAQPDPEYPTAQYPTTKYRTTQDPTIQGPSGQAPYAGYYPADYYGGGYYPPPAAPARSAKRGWRLGAGIAALTAAALVGGIAIGDATRTTSGSGSTAALVPDSPSNGSGNSSG